MSKRVSGIYVIINEVDGKFYVGSACSIKKRWKRHKDDLRSGKHANRYFQRAWIKHGEKSFYFGILELVEDVWDLLSREQFWLDELRPFDSNVGYNISPTAGSILGTHYTLEARQKISVATMGEKNPFYGRHHSDKTKQTISEAKTGENHQNYGKHLSEKTRKKIAESKLGDKNPSYKAAKRYSINGRDQTLKEWAREYEISPTVVNVRVTTCGWDINDALTTPVVCPRQWEYLGRFQTLREWALEYGIKPSIVQTRVNSQGWTLELALTVPLRVRKNKGDFK